MKLSQILNELNVIDQEPIDKALENYWFFHRESGKIKNWFQTKVKKYIQNDKRNFSKLGSGAKSFYLNDEQSPTWLKQAIERGDAVYEFVGINSETDQKLKDIVDYTESRDFTEWNKLDRISVQDMIRKADAWHEQLARRAEKEKNKKIADDSHLVKTIYSFADGYRIVELPDDACKTREGELMGHCVGRGGYSNKTILSLRDAKNQPHATMEISGDDPNTIVQLQGKANQDIVEKYWPYLWEFLEKTPYQLTDSYLMKVGLVNINGQYLPFNRLGEFDKLEIDGSLDLSGQQSNFELPLELSVYGDLFLNHSSLTKLPQTLYVQRRLLLGNTNIKSITSLIEVGQDLDLRYTKNLQKLPDGLTVGGGLNLAGSAIEQLPEFLTVKEDLILNRSQVKELPKGLFVGGDLHLAETKIEKLS